MADERKSASFIAKSLIAGGIAGCAAKTAVAPLDRVKILFQTNNAAFEHYQGSMRGVILAGRHILALDGYTGLFRGHGATLLRIFPYAAIKFMAYEQYKSLLAPREQTMTKGVLNRSTGREFIAGSLAGMTSVMFTYPLELIRVRMAYDTTSTLQSTQKSSTTNSHHGRLWRTAKDIIIVHDSNNITKLRVTNLYRGLSPTLMGMIPYAGVSFAAHGLAADWFRAYIPGSIIAETDKISTEPSRRILDKDGRRRLKAWAELAAGGFAGMMGQTVSYPLEIIRRRMQVVDVSKPTPRIIDVVKGIYVTKGFRGFWVGLAIGYVKVVPLVGVSFAVYEKCKYWFGIS